MMNLTSLIKFFFFQTSGNGAGDHAQGQKGAGFLQDPDHAHLSGFHQRGQQHFLWGCGPARHSACIQKLAQYQSADGGGKRHTTQARRK